ncbi:MAG TPA: hypothetical protein VI408_09035 [Gaiellaceae bacterium]
MAENVSGKGDFGKRLAHKALMPIVATAASAAAGYVAKKGPAFFEENVLPKLKELGSGAGGVASNVPQKAKDVAGGAGDLAEGLTSRVKEASPVGNGNGSGNGSSRGGLSQDELERHVRERAEARAARRKSTRKAR